MQHGTKHRRLLAANPAKDQLYSLEPSGQIPARPHALDLAFARPRSLGLHSPQQTFPVRLLSEPAAPAARLDSAELNRLRSNQHERSPLQQLARPQPTELASC